jgi:hypothetical protein
MEYMGQMLHLDLYGDNTVQTYIALLIPLLMLERRSMLRWPVHSINI